MTDVDPGIALLIGAALGAMAGWAAGQISAVKPLKPITDPFGELRAYLTQTLETIQMDVKQVLADIEAQTTVVAGMVAAFKAAQESNAALSQAVTDLRAQVAAGNTANLDPALQEIDDKLKANTQLLAGALPAVVENTGETLPADAGASGSTEQPQT